MLREESASRSAVSPMQQRLVESEFAAPVRGAPLSAVQVVVSLVQEAGVQGVGGAESV